MKSCVAFIAVVLLTLILTCCAAPAAAPCDVAEEVVIKVVTSYGGYDGNRANYEAAVAAYEEETGVKVTDDSGVANEEWKTKVMTDFQAGAEPDVLFYFNGADSNQLIEAGKVVPLDEIRKEYPDYASNMKDDMLGASPLDGKNYSVPVNGYWEGLYVNIKVLKACGVPVPDEAYTWESFLSDCEIIKEAGYIPIAVSLHEIPHYLFEFTVLNHGNTTNHAQLPRYAADAVGQKWAAGIADIKSLYQAGYLPPNTFAATDAETNQLLADGQAAFMIDGSWKVGWFRQNASVSDITVTYMPGTKERRTTDIIGGLSMGYYITRTAWDNPVKREACVSFITAMTKDEVVSTFSTAGLTALKEPPQEPVNADGLDIAARYMMEHATGITTAAQDALTTKARQALFSNIKNVVMGKLTAQEAINGALELNKW